MPCSLIVIGVSKDVQKVKRLTDVASGAATIELLNKKIKLSDKMSFFCTGT